MHLRKHNLLVLSSFLFVSPLLAQVNSRDPGRSPDFQTTCDEEVNNERVAKAVPASDPTPTPSTSSAPVATNTYNSKLSVDQIIQNAIRRD